jgi:hypothetical protein
MPVCVPAIGFILESDINQRMEWNREDSVIHIVSTIVKFWLDYSRI